MFLFLPFNASARRNARRRTLLFVLLILTIASQNVKVFFTLSLFISSDSNLAAKASDEGRLHVPSFFAAAMIGSENYDIYKFQCKQYLVPVTIVLFIYSM